eukprot:CAMPEP_0170594712 /NCGR_PEP_ID=MMETSP0224-20130122/14150_1 /TAXON_ID=285029 /ORGANISM="Togula jolla, Strain CCCM 725" /LENGTH=205 /DNA_ID=CAMNT_0010918795 /DNA_START=41 /DNA_END=658 /DNA_ORIENTATION=-
MAVQSAVETRRRGRAGAVLAGAALIGLCVCSLAAVTQSPAWAAPMDRRAAVTAALVAPLVFSSEAHAQQAVLPGAEDDLESSAFGADPPEVVEARKKARAEGKKKQAEAKEKFRALFADFAGEDKSVPARIELLGKMQDMVLQDAMLPIGISREDIVKGVRAVKFNIGCTKMSVKQGECKQLEKAYMKLLGTVDKVNDRQIISGR